MCGGGSKGTSTSTTSTTMPPEMLAAYQALLGFGSTAAGQPLSQYQGPQVAGFTPDQNNAFGLAENAAGSWAPMVNQSSNWYGSAANPIYNQIPQYSTANLNQYMDPWNQDVIDATSANIDRSNEMQQSQLKGTASSMGASPLWGDRAGVAAAELARTQDLAKNQTMAGLKSQGFLNGQQQFNNQQGFQANTMGSDASRSLSAAGGMSGLAQAMQGMSQADIRSLLGNGSLQQALGQAQLQIPKTQFDEQQQYPFKMADFLRQMVSGINMGQQTSTSSTPAAPNPFTQIAGLGLSLAGLPAGGGFLGTLLSGIGLKDGGRIRDYDAGGGVPQIDASRFRVPAGHGWDSTQVPDGPGFHTGSQTYINGLPILHPESMPPPRVYQMSPELKAQLAKFHTGTSSGSSGNSGHPLQDLFSNLFPNHPASGGSGGLGGIFDTLFPGHSSGIPAPVTPTTPAPPGPLMQPVSGFASGGATDDNKGLAAAVPKVPPRSLPPGRELMNMGLGMMASTSPYFLQGVGQGAQAGQKASQEQLAAMDAGAQVINDGKEYSVFYPSTGETIKLGLPVAQDWSVQTDPRTLTPYLFNPKTGESKPMQVPGTDQYGNPTDPNATPGANGAPSLVDAPLDINGKPIDPKIVSGNQKETGVGFNYDSLPPTGQAWVRMMVAGQVAAVTGRTLNSVPAGAGAPWIKLIDAANEYAVRNGDPGGFNQNIWSQRVSANKEFTSGGAQSPATQITSANKVIGHLNALWGDIDSLGNVSGDQMPGFVKALGLDGPIAVAANTATQFLAGGRGDAKSNAIAQATIDRHLVSDEITKFFASGGAGGGEGEIKRHLDDIDLHKSPNEIKSAIQATVGLMESQLHAYETRWHNAMGPIAKPPGGSIITPQNQGILDNITQWTPTTAAAPAVVPKQAPAGGPQSDADILKSLGVH